MGIVPQRQPDFNGSAAAAGVIRIKAARPQAERRNFPPHDAAERTMLLRYWRSKDGTDVD
jgi:hypothetical protein